MCAWTGIALAAAAAATQKERLIKRARPHKHTHIHICTHAASQYTMRTVCSSVQRRLLPASFSLTLRSLVLVLLCMTRKLTHLNCHIYVIINATL